MTHKLFAPVQVPDPRPYSGHPMKKGSIYIEDGQLEETYLVHIWSLDMDGRYVDEDFGFFEVKPEYFDCEIRAARTRDGVHTWYEYRWNQTGLDYLGNTFKLYPDRFAMVTVDEVRREIASLERQAAAVQRRADQMKKLLKD